MSTLVAGLIVFFAIHLVPTQRSWRDGLIARFGASGYQGFFSLVSLVGLVLIVMGYGALSAAPARVNPQLWVSPSWMRHVTYLLMLPAMILLAAAYVPSRIRDAVGHPMLAAIKVWALAHLLVRGDLAAVLLFGSFLAYGAFDRISVKRRAALGQHTLGPLGAQPGTARGDVAATIIGLAAYAFMLVVGHSLLIGVPLTRFSFAP